MMNDMEESEPSMPDMEHATAEVYIPSPWGFLISLAPMNDNVQM